MACVEEASPGVLPGAMIDRLAEVIGVIKLQRYPCCND